MGRNRHEITKKSINIGDKSYGWVCVKLYEHHNLWVRNSKSNCVIRECFPKNGKPNENANYQYEA